MELEMRVIKQITEEDSDETKPTKYKVMLSHFSTAKQVSKLRVIKKLTITREDATLFEEFQHNDLIAVKVSKPQSRLQVAKEV